MELGFCFESGGSQARFGVEEGVVLTGFLWLHSEKRTLG